MLCLAGCSDLLKYDELSFDDAGTAAGEGGAGGEPDYDGCVPTSCAELGAECGQAQDGCGNALECGTCGDGLTCGAAGTNRCGSGECVPKTCSELGADCGSVSDGCSATLACGDCTSPETCGGAGKANQCGCKAANCADVAAECGTIDNACGGTADCGKCQQPGAVCEANKCACTPATCVGAGYQCGPLADGCGQTLDCGGCSGGDVCGGDGTPHKCSPPTGHHETKTETGGTGNEPDGVIPVCCVPSTAEKALIMEAFDLLNQHRASKGIAALTYDEKLEAAIEGHCHHMAAHDFFDHNAPESSVSSPWTRAAACGTSASGENIAAGQGTADGVMQSWINSPGHNANMLNSGFTRVGIGYFEGGSWGTYWGQIFD